MQTQTPIDQASERHPLIGQILEARLAALRENPVLSSWSLIVTFLGDAIGPRGGIVSATALQAIMQHLGIGAGAVRTAISRLAADGWIERSREGRNSFYQLSSDVRETVKTAERRIYAPTSLLPADNPRCLVITAQPLLDATSQALEALGVLHLSSETFICFADAQTLTERFRLSEATIAQTPDIRPGTALLETLARSRLTREIEILRNAYLPLMQALDRAANHSQTLPPHEAMALRCLMIHEWRRLALKILPIPCDLLQADDYEPETRALIATIYAKLLPASETWLDENAATPSGPLPAADTGLAKRFAAL